MLTSAIRRMLCYTRDTEIHALFLYAQTSRLFLFIYYLEFIFMSAIKHPEQRVAIFIDTQNLYHSARNLYKARVNFQNVLKDALAGRKLVRAIAYVITSEGRRRRSVFRRTNQNGNRNQNKKTCKYLQVVAKKVTGTSDSRLMLSKWHHDSTRSSSYQVMETLFPLVQYLQTMTQVEVISFGKSTSMKLKEVVDDFVDLSENPRRYLIGTGRGK
jgi:uncharacterized LabA/DUF88 family protein